MPPKPKTIRSQAIAKSCFPLAGIGDTMRNGPRIAIFTNHAMRQKAMTSTTKHAIMAGPRKIPIPPILPRTKKTEIVSVPHSPRIAEPKNRENDREVGRNHGQESGEGGRGQVQLRPLGGGVAPSPFLFLRWIGEIGPPQRQKRGPKGK